MKSPAESIDKRPLFELRYADTLSAAPRSARSQQGKLLVRLPEGAAFRWLSLRIVSSAIPLTLGYSCVYTRAGASGTLVAEAPEGGQCPAGDDGRIKRVVFRSKIYYRSWVAGGARAGAPERSPAGMFWCYNGQPCGTEADDRWITALEIMMPPLVEGWRTA